jgi:hypothetical protein
MLDGPTQNTESIFCDAFIHIHLQRHTRTRTYTRARVHIHWHTLQCVAYVVMHTSQFNVCLPFADTQVVTYFNEVFCPLLHNCVHIKYICGIASYHSPLECTDACTEGAHTHVQF